MKLSALLKAEKNGYLEEQLALQRANAGSSGFTTESYVLEIIKMRHAKNLKDYPWKMLLENIFTVIIKNTSSSSAKKTALSDGFFIGRGYRIIHGLIAIPSTP